MSWADGYPTLDDMIYHVDFNTTDGRTLTAHGHPDVDTWYVIATDEDDAEVALGIEDERRAKAALSVEAEGEAEAWREDQGALYGQARKDGR